MFSVVIPVAGEGQLLQAAVESAVSPLVSRIVVVADDAAALPAARTCAEVFKQVTVLETPGVGRRGPGAARNLGLAELLGRSDSTWLTFLDADDTYAPGYFEALAPIVSRARAEGAPVVHTCLMSLTEREGQTNITEVHPLRYRFEQGSRFVSLAQEPHIIGTSVAAAVFDCSTLEDTGVRFTEGINWSEDSDFMVRFLLASGAQKVGVCADAHYRYRVQQGGSTTESAWTNPLKYTLPFERFYLPWAHSSASLPEWLQNQLLYEMSIYLQVDRQVLSPAFDIDQSVLDSCSDYFQQVVGCLDSRVIESFALVPLGLDRRQMLLAVSAQGQQLPYYPVTSRQVFRYRKRPWRSLTKFTYFYTVQGCGGRDVPAEIFAHGGQEVAAAEAKWVSHTFFGRELVRERILWFEIEPSFFINGQSLDAQPYSGAPSLPRAAQGVASEQVQSGVREASGAKVASLKLRLKKQLWRIKKRLTADQVSPAPERLSLASKSIWFYADRSHRAGDNAEAFYRHASQQLPAVRHVFFLSRESLDWSRLEAEGFDLVDAGSSESQRLFGEAHTLLLSDISDTGISALLTGVKAHQRLVFVQHGILRRDHWRWLNPRRIDLMITTLPEETEALIGDGSRYTLTGVEVVQTGLPRHDALLELASTEKRRDRVLLAPTWQPHLLAASRQEFAQWFDTWLTPFAQVSGQGSLRGLQPVFFVHPNMESCLAELGLELPCETVFGADLPAALVRSVAVVSDVSSIADEALAVGVPVILRLDADAPVARRLISLLEHPGVDVVAPGDEVALLDALTRAHKAGRRAPAVESGARRRLLNALTNNQETRKALETSAKGTKTQD